MLVFNTVELHVLTNIKGSIFAHSLYSQFLGQEDLSHHTNLCCNQVRRKKCNQPEQTYQSCCNLLSNLIYLLLSEVIGDTIHCHYILDTK